jgi:hypothetical protein
MTENRPAAKRTPRKKPPAKRPAPKRTPRKKPAEQAGKFRTGLRFETILTNAEQSIRLDLDRARLESSHSGTIGDHTEAAVRKALRGYVPATYSVGEGHVYDAYGDGSQQTDVVITNQDHPLTFPEGRSGTYLVDGVAAVGEVKTRLDSKELDDCITKGTTFKGLRMTGREGDFVLNVKEQAYLRQMGMVPPFFVIAIDCTLKPETVSKKLMKAGLVSPPAGKSAGPLDDADTPQPPVDAICILGKGVHLYIRPDNPFGMKIVGAPQGQPVWAFIPTDAPLSFTLMWLHSAMPQMIRGKSVLVPYLMPTSKNIKYMVDRGYITVTNHVPPPSQGA